MNQETKKAVLACAALCEEAGIRSGERILRICADDPDSRDQTAETWLERVQFAAEVLADERFANGGDHESATRVRRACFQASNASIGRRWGAPVHCEHCPAEGPCNVCGRAA